MQIYKINIDVPYFYGFIENDDPRIDDARRDQVDFENLVGDARMSQISGTPEHAPQFLVDEAGFKLVIGALPLKDFQKISIAEIVVAFDSEDTEVVTFDVVLAKLEAKLEKALDQGTVDNARGYNHKAEAFIPDMQVNNVNDLLLIEDGCTDAVQGALDQGWRLLAICPQYSRRPDYILGRFLPVSRLGGVALRSL